MTVAQPHATWKRVLKHGFVAQRQRQEQQRQWEEQQRWHEELERQQWQEPHQQAREWPEGQQYGGEAGPSQPRMPYN